MSGFLAINDLPHAHLDETELSWPLNKLVSPCCFAEMMTTTTNELPRDKTNKVAVHPAKTQISLGIRSVWSESSLCTQWVAKDTSFL